MDSELIVKIVAIIVGAEGLFKALEYFAGKLITASNKSKQIDTNEMTLAEYKKKTDKDIAELNTKMQEARGYAVTSLKDLEKSITDTLKDHKDEYMNKIASVETSIANMQSVYQQTVAVVEIKIENLEKAQNKHNSLMERMYEVEKRTEVHEEMIKVANNRIADLERNEHEKGNN